MLAEQTKPNAARVVAKCIVASALSVFFYSFLGCGSNDAPNATVEAETTTDPSPTTATDKAPEPDRESNTFDRETAIRTFEKLLDAGKPKQAISALQQVLLIDPTDAEVLFRLARVHAGMNELDQAVELLRSIPADHPDAGLPALGQSADWCMVLGRYDQAETNYKRVLETSPRFAHAHRQLAYLFNRQGRRHEAAVHLQELCRIGNIQQDELHALMVLSHAIIDDEKSAQNKKRPYFPIGPNAKARMLYTANRYADAVQALDELVQSDSRIPSVMAFYGLLAVESQDDDRFKWWLANIDESTKEFAEYWSAIGTHLLSKHRFDEAVRAFAEAIVRDPTDAASMRRINQALTSLGKHDAAERWIDRYVTQRDVTLASNAIGETKTPSPESYQTVVNGLIELQRPLEAAAWRLFQAFHEQASQAEIKSLNSERSKLFRAKNAFPSREDRLCNIKLEDFPLPNIEKPEIAAASFPTPSEFNEQIETPVFENATQRIGLQHAYEIASKRQPFQFALYQSLGGGIAAFDYELDGNVDLYLAQGSGDPPELIGKKTDLLYRNFEGALHDVTIASGLEDYQYSIGTAAGDWNQDGFIDLVVANIGRKVLLINNGDGTFARHDFDVDDKNAVLVSSVGMGDVTGDNLPDIVSLHYVEDATMINRPKLDEQGNVLTVSPASFKAGIDRIAVNKGDGDLDTVKVSDSAKTPSTGLGLVIADWNQKPGNEIFVGNDVRPNHLWVRSENELEWTDVAAVSGCAHGHGGVATASMGIAVADFDNSGTRDIHITNFYLEPVSLFMNRGTTFEDRCVQYKLHRPSSTVLGFGCQALDYNNDGRPDLAVTNGNIEKAPGEPLEQSPQFFVNLGSEFQLNNVQDDSMYWQGKYLGRGMARLDLNRDGKQDLCITHLGSPSVLLLNQTQTKNHWLSIRLVGTESERDAIGTQIEVTSATGKLTNWLVGGDGYLCRNEPTVSFGLGTATQVDEIQVTWPSGKKEQFSGIATDQEILIVENIGVFE